MSFSSRPTALDSRAAPWPCFQLFFSAPLPVEGFLLRPRRSTFTLQVSHFSFQVSSFSSPPKCQRARPLRFCRVFLRCEHRAHTQADAANSFVSRRLKKNTPAVQWTLKCAAFVCSRSLLFDFLFEFVHAKGQISTERWNGKAALIFRQTGNPNAAVTCADARHSTGSIVEANNDILDCLHALVRAVDPTDLEGKLRIVSKMRIREYSPSR